MRLDHLLSKERHPSKGGMEPRVTCVGWWGAHWSETLASWRWQRFDALVHAPCGGWGKGLMMRLVLAVDTLLGPEGMTVWLFLGPCCL